MDAVQPRLHLICHVDEYRGARCWIAHRQEDEFTVVSRKKEIERKSSIVTIRLRPTKHEDISYVIQAEKSPENRSFVGQWTESEHLSSLNNNDLLHLIVERMSDNQPVGYIILAGIENQNQSIEFRRIVITEKSAGYGRAVLKAVKKLAFEENQAHRLWLDVREFNQKAQHLYKSEGFQVEGLLRECVKMEDRYESLIIMSMLASEYDRS